MILILLSNQETVQQQHSQAPTAGRVSHYVSAGAQMNTAHAPLLRSMSSCIHIAQAKGSL